MTTEQTKELSHMLGKLMQDGFKMGSVIAQIHVIREKIAREEFQAKDKEDIMIAVFALQTVVEKTYDHVMPVFKEFLK